jgi:hypothetical protein
LVASLPAAARQHVADWRGCVARSGRASDRGELKMLIAFARSVAALSAALAPPAAAVATAEPATDAAAPPGATTA